MENNRKSLISGGPDHRQAERLRQLIIEKNSLYRHKLRPINKTYIFLFRRHEMGHLAREMEDFDELVTMQARKHDPLAQLPKMVHNKSEHFCKLDVSELSAASRKALAEVYAEDIKLFGYSPDAPHMLPQKGAFKMPAWPAFAGPPSSAPRLPLTLVWLSV